MILIVCVVQLFIEGRGPNYWKLKTGNKESVLVGTTFWQLDPYGTGGL